MNLNAYSEPIRVTNLRVGAVVIVCQAAFLWSVGADLKAMVGAAAIDIIGLVTAGEIGRRKVWSEESVDELDKVAFNDGLNTRPNYTSALYEGHLLEDVVSEARKMLERDLDPDA